MNTSSSSAQRLAVAGALLDSGCVAVRADEPFRLPSGWASPVYMDGRRLIAYPGARALVLRAALDRLAADGTLTGLTGVVGGESSGIALAAWLAQALELPLHYVRKRPIGGRRIEGHVQPGDRVLLVDDVMAVGQSKVRFAQALQDAGAVVQAGLVVFSYNAFPLTQDLAALQLNIASLADWHDVLAVARERGSFSAPALQELRVFLDNPVAWSLAHQGLGSATVPAGGGQENSQ